MKNFTPTDEARPSEMTLSIIRHIAHIYRVTKNSGSDKACYAS